MRVVVNYRKGQKQLKKFVLQLNNALARPPIYDRAYTEMLSTDSSGNPVAITKPSALLLIVQPDKNFWSINVKEPYLLTIFGNKSRKKFAPSRNLHQNSLPYTLLKLFPNSCDMHYFEACWTGSNSNNGKNSIFLHKILWKIRKLSAIDWLQLTLPIPSPNHCWDGIHGILGQRSATK